MLLKQLGVSFFVVSTGMSQEFCCRNLGVTGTAQ
jgi:hypothetical protein